MGGFGPLKYPEVICRLELNRIAVERDQKSKKGFLAPYIPVYKTVRDRSKAACADSCT
jgi:hypothetical protein